MALREHTPQLTLREEAVIVLFCQVDDIHTTGSIRKVVVASP
jgi:hypothetical protein